MISVKGYAAQSATTVLTPFSFQRRELGPRDILIEIDYCGICHSDIHQVRNEWGDLFILWCLATRLWEW